MRWVHLTTLLETQDNNDYLYFLVQIIALNIGISTLSIGRGKKYQKKGSEQHVDKFSLLFGILWMIKLEKIMDCSYNKYHESLEKNYFCISFSSYLVKTDTNISSCTRLRDI